MTVISMSQYRLQKERDIASYTITELKQLLKDGDLDLFQLMMVQQRLTEIDRNLIKEYSE